MGPKVLSKLVAVPLRKEFERKLQKAHINSTLDDICAENAKAKMAMSCGAVRVTDEGVSVARKRCKRKTPGGLPAAADLHVLADAGAEAEDQATAAVAVS